MVYQQAMQAVGLGGREPESLNGEEQVRIFRLSQIFFPTWSLTSFVIFRAISRPICGRRGLLDSLQRLSCSSSGRRHNGTAPYPSPSGCTPESSSNKEGFRQTSILFVSLITLPRVLVASIFH